MLGDVGLHEERGALRVDPAGDVLGGGAADPLPQLLRGWGTVIACMSGMKKNAS